MPGFKIRNCTPWPLTVSLEQVGPLYHGIVEPEEYFVRETGAVWFTIKAVISVDHEDHVTDWDCVWPILDVVITVLSTAISLGQAGLAYKAASKATTLALRATAAARQAKTLVAAAEMAVKGATTASAKASARVALRQAQRQAVVASRKAVIASTKASVKSISKGGRVIKAFSIAKGIDFTAEKLAEIFEENSDTSEAGCYAGSPGQDKLEEYSIIGGPKYQYDMENDHLTVGYGEKMKIVEGILPLPAQFVHVSPIVHGASSADANLHFNGASCVYGEKMGVVKINSIPGQFSYKTSSEKIVTVGQQNINLKFTPDDQVNYKPATKKVTLTVLQAEPRLTVKGGTFTFDEDPHTGSATAIGGAGESLYVNPLVYEGTTAVGEIYGPTETPPVAAGKYVITAHTPGDDNNLSASKKATITIRPAKAKVLAAKALKIRKGHSIHANVLDWLRHDDLVDVFSTWTDEKGKWAQIGPGQWASIYYKKKTWMEFILS